ncbi:MAG: ABC transporter ATP-binding protein [Bifidobacteriaceae bacterium]|jgi:ABC-2 type transport system ATP-binding protein|nr:ABC transporter ATP-binding protein [Bifidobacteriaceae bacterium]
MPLPPLPAAAADPPGPAVAIRDLKVVRGKRVVLPGLSLTIPRRQLVGLLGPSGGGKTTLLRAIVGAQITAGGLVEVLGRPAGDPELRRKVGYMTQAASVYADLTVAENLEYFAALAGVGRDRVAAVTEQVDLGRHRSDTVRDLSGGERSRVSLAVALLAQPELLVLDEPTVGLDPVLRVSLWALFRDLAAGGTSLLVSSHVMDEATRCDRLILLHAGRVLADATPAELLAQTGAASAEEAFLALERAARSAR